MTEKFYTMEVNCETKESVVREMTAEETAAHLLFIEESKAIAEERAAAEEHARTLKQSALAKLEALGLTPEEAAAL